MDNKTLSILVIDDNERFRAVLGFLLEANRFRVKLAATHEEALICLKAEFFSLVITDFVLGPIEASEGIARSLLAAANPVPVGCLTGWSDIPANLENQFAFVLRKPVTGEGILAAVGSSVGLRLGGASAASIVEFRKSRQAGTRGSRR